MSRLNILLSLYLSFRPYILLYGQKMDISSPAIGRVTCVARLTGTSLPEEEFMSPNSTVQQWNIGGTDLGIIWEQAPGKIRNIFW